jgi:acyl carrier protein
MPLDESVRKAVARDVDRILIPKISEIARVNLNLKEPREISEEEHFENDLLFDSLDYTDLFIDIEDNFNIDMTKDEGTNLSNRRNLREYVVDKIEQREDSIEY